MKNKLAIAAALATSITAHAGPSGSPGNDVGRWPMVQAAEQSVTLRSAAGLAGTIIPPAPVVEPRASGAAASPAPAQRTSLSVPAATHPSVVEQRPAAVAGTTAEPSASRGGVVGAPPAHPAVAQRASTLPPLAIPSKVAEQDNVARAMMAKLTVMRNKIAGTTSDVVQASMQLLGIKYKWGGNNEEEGFDCSGFVVAVFERTVGLVLPRTAAEQARATEKIEKHDLIPGDLVFFNTLRREFSHVGIYLGGGRFIHAPRAGATIRVDNMNKPYWTKRFNGARRVATAEEQQD